jgi:hypothetical protein
VLRRLAVDLLVDVLRLAAGAERRHHDPPRHRDGNLGAVILGHEVEAQVDPGRRPGRGHHAILRHVEHVGVDLHAREPPAQAVGVNPVRGRPAIVEQAGEREDECAGAKRNHPRPAVVRLPELTAERVGGRHVRVDPAGDDDRVRAGQLLEPVRRMDVEAGVGAYRRLPRGDELELVPRIDDVPAVVAEDLGGDREVEGERALVDDGGDGVHVRNLAIIG